MASNINSQFSVSWDSYQTNVCSGFSAFQQSGEFVDMTIAADGHVVKVHQALIALASPYLKEIILSTPTNQHPIIFLNNVDYNTLCALLEYIYTGEVVVPIENFTKFLEIGKSLHIRGLENVMDMKPKSMTASSNQRDLTQGLKPVVVKSGRVSEMISIPLNAKKVYSIPVSASATNISTLTSSENNEGYEMDTTFDDDAGDVDDTDTDHNRHNISQTQPSTNTGRIEANVQFTVSTRGNLQMILNRFLYNVQSKSQRSSTRRWRCVDYRNLRCPAYVITKGSTVVNRGHPHNHSFHDKKILSKLDNKAVYSAIDDVAGINEEDDDMTEHDQSI